MESVVKIADSKQCGQVKKRCDMTEKERKKHLQDLQNMQHQKIRTRRSKKGRRYEEKSVQTFALRMYVTVIFVGGVLTVSLFQTDTAQALCQKVKETIRQEMPEADIMAMKNHLQDLWQGNFSLQTKESLPEIQESEEDDTEITVPVSQNEGTGVTGIYYPDVNYDWSP